MTTPTATEMFQDTLSRNIPLQFRYMFAVQRGDRLYSLFTGTHLYYNRELMVCFELSN